VLPLDTPFFAVERELTVLRTLVGA
jgi:serine/threonine protein kinase